MMTSNRLHTLEQCGQSIWLDSLSRDLIHSGTFSRLVQEDGISGVTANPSIFEKAIVDSHDYDESIRAPGATGRPPIQIYEDLAIQDVGAAADTLRATYDRREAVDGFASIEVSPDLAHDTRASIDEARRFWRELDRPNVMVKIPATPEGIPAIEQLTAVEMYERVMNAYLTGLERRVKQGQSIAHIASVASFFVSRVDTFVDRLLVERSRKADEGKRVSLKVLEGKIAVANAKIAYERFQQFFGSERFLQLARNGGTMQRPLWSSTSTKNPKLPDTLYVSSLVGAHTVNTMPMETIDAFRDHGAVDCGAVTQGVDEAREDISNLERAGISMKTVTDELIRDGVEKFSKALHSLLDTIEQRQHSPVAG
jgi:transaldolase